MSRVFLALCATALISACDNTNPFQDTPQEPTTPSEGTPDTDPNNIYATALNADLVMNSFRYEDNGTPATADDRLLINNIPFDNSDASGGGYTPTGPTLANGFQVYESNASGSPSREYFAVFRRATHSEVAAVGTGDYVTFGFGGATAQPLSNTNGIPAQRTNFYTFTGDYAAVRVTTDQGGSDDVEFVTGDATLFVDILDFDVKGAVEGNISNRELFDVNGNSLGTLADNIALATAEINFNTGVIGASDAKSLEGTNENASGKWQGVFAGPNGEEIAGFVVVEGSTTSAETNDDLRETGVFIVENQG